MITGEEYGRKAVREDPMGKSQFSDSIPSSGMSETKVVELIIIHTPGKAFLPLLYHETAYIGSPKFCLFSI